MDTKISQLISLYDQETFDIEEAKSLILQIPSDELHKYIHGASPTVSSPGTPINTIVTIAYHLKNIRVIKTVTTNNPITYIGRLIALEDWDNSVTEFAEIFLNRLWTIV